MTVTTTNNSVLEALGYRVEDDVGQIYSLPFAAYFGKSECIGFGRTPTECWLLCAHHCAQRGAQVTVTITNTNNPVLEALGYRVEDDVGQIYSLPFAAYFGKLECIGYGRTPTECWLLCAHHCAQRVERVERDKKEE